MPSPTRGRPPRQGRGVQVRQVPPRVQAGECGAGPPQVAADPLHPAQGGLFAAHLRQPPVQHGRKFRPAVPQGPKRLDGYSQPPQQLDLLQGPQVLLAVIPVAVTGPGGGQQPLRLVVADIGPGHAGPGLHLLAGQ